MLGYVIIDKEELKIREFEVYQGYYCGICKSIGDRIGQACRMVLSYDAAFLALLLDSLNSKNEDLRKEHCVVHHIQKKSVIRENVAIDYAADVMIVLAYFNMLDNVKDNGGIKDRALETLFRRYFKKLNRTYKSLCIDIERELSILDENEKNLSSNLDRVSENFAIIMESIFVNYPGLSKNEKMALGVIGKHLGKWIYLIDAADDLFDDIGEEKYNPLIYRFEYEKFLTQNQIIETSGIESDLNYFEEQSKKVKTKAEEKLNLLFWEGIRERVEFNLYQHLAEINQALELLPIVKNKGIIENIVLMGLRKRTEAILIKNDNYGSEKCTNCNNIVQKE